jgi:hypothetical protein
MVYSRLAATQPRWFGSSRTSVLGSPRIEVVDHAHLVSHQPVNTVSTAYRVDRSLKVQELGQVALEDTKHVVDACFPRLQAHYDSGEEALSETMFGFSRSDAEFIELCIHDFTSISCKIELPSLPSSWWRRIRRGSSAFEADLHSGGEVIEIVAAFLTLGEEEFAKALQRWSRSRSKGATLRIADVTGQA